MPPALLAGREFLFKIKGLQSNGMCPYFFPISFISFIQRNKYEGIGKPEPLKHNLAGYWSRRITSEHRLVYRIEEDKLLIAKLRYHY